jgi:Zinc-ribbon containing domain
MSDQQPGQEEQGPGPGRPREPLAELYEAMSRILREKMERAGTFTEEAFERALHETREWADKFRGTYGEDIARVSEYIRRDWHAAIGYMQGQVRRNFDVDRLQAGALDVLANLARSAGAQLDAFASKLNERLTYKTGEIAGAGSLLCNGCGQLLAFDKATRIPPCPKCHGTVFRRSF